jgi:hypothetical protein
MNSLYWVIQEGFSNEEGMVELVRLLEKYGQSYGMVKTVPFIGEIVPDLDLSDYKHVICFGSYSMRYTCRVKGWNPGVIDMEVGATQIYHNSWKPYLLNHDFYECDFINVGVYVDHMGYDSFFMRPINDSKVFAGGIYYYDEMREWIQNVSDLGYDATTLRVDTSCIISSIKEIYAEYRLFVIGGRVVTASQYKIGGRVQYSSIVDDDILEFGQMLVDMEPNFGVAYCLDLCRVESGIKVVEVNTINSAGFYHGNVDKIIRAFYELYDEYEDLV